MNGYRYHRTPGENRGSTLVELVILLLLISILVVQLLPRVLDLSEEAEMAKLKQIEVSYHQAVGWVQLTWKLQQHPTRVQNLQGFGSNDVDTNNIGFPIGTDKGNGNENVGRGRAGCVLLWRGLMLGAPSVSTSNDGSEFHAYRHTNNKVCSYVYRANGDSRNRNRAEYVIKYDSRDGTVVLCGSSPTLPAC